AAYGRAGRLHWGPDLNRQDLEGASPVREGDHRVVHRSPDRKSGELEVEVSADQRPDRGVTEGSPWRATMKIIASADRAFKAAVKKVVSRSWLQGDKGEGSVRSIHKPAERV